MANVKIALSTPILILKGKAAFQMIVITRLKFLEKMVSALSVLITPIQSQ